MIFSVVAAVCLGTRGAIAFPKNQQTWPVTFRYISAVEASSVHNIHVTFEEVVDGPVEITYGACTNFEEPISTHQVITKTHIKEDVQPDRFVWIVPADATHGGCLHATSPLLGLLGRSEPIEVRRPLKKRETIADVADTLGPWFDGVAYIESSNVSAVESAKAKSKKIAIVGGGMSGLMTSLLLQSVGIEDWHIIESSQRVGGRVHTSYLNNTRPDDYQYQEMGPMRFPVSWTDKETNETVEIQDHKMVFQLADTLNKMNGNNTELAVNFIQWIQNSPNTPINSNGYRLENGRVPSRAQLAANSSLMTPAASAEDPEAAKAAEEEFEKFVDLSNEKLKEISRNVFKAHKQAVEDGYFHYSEAAYLRYALDLNDNLTDYIAGADMSPIWEYDTVYFSADKWRTIDKGLSSLPAAFHPHVDGKVIYGRKVEGLTFDNDTQKIAVNWRDSPLDVNAKSEEFDYAVVAVPFSKVRLWRTPVYSSSLSRAIQSMNYQQSCKVALHYETRFWEHLDPPIIGGCGSTDIPGIGSVCYPAYAINSSGPGVLLASYSSGVPARSLGALSESDHVGLVQRAMIEIHGQVAADRYTGVYDRICWEANEHQAGAWAAPFVGQQDLYLPAYYQTEWKTIFVGEHTSYTHAWIFSALDSAVRGTTQLLLDMGLVDEAKEIVNTWMARWISV